jgi:hypothetical protein
MLARIRRNEEQRRGAKTMNIDIDIATLRRVLTHLKHRSQELGTKESKDLAASLELAVNSAAERNKPKPVKLTIGAGRHWEAGPYNSYAGQCLCRNCGGYANDHNNGLCRH